MGIIIAFAVFAAVAFLRLRYRPAGKNAVRLFYTCLFAGVVMLLGVGTLSSWSGVAFYLADAVICSLLVLSYRVEAKRQAAVRAKRRAARRAAISEQTACPAYTERRPLSSFAAFTESVGEAA